MASRRGRRSSSFFNWILPFGAMFLPCGFVMQRMGGGPSALPLGRSKATMYADDENSKVRFADVAGVDEAVALRLLAQEKLEYADLVEILGPRSVAETPPTIVATPAA